MYKLPKNDNTYEWTNHSKNKMVYYGVSESRIKRIIRYPQRIEEGIAENTIAVMQSANTKQKQEIWVMYQRKIKNQISKIKNTNQELKITKLKDEAPDGQKIRIISVWRYPGISPKRNPVPQEILKEIQSLL